MVHRQPRLIFIVTSCFLLGGALIVLWGGDPQLQGYMGQVQETSPRFFVTRHLARLVTWPAIQQEGNRTISWTDPETTGAQTSFQTGMLTLATHTYFLPNKGSDTSWQAHIDNVHGFTTSGSVLARGSSGYLQFAESSLPKTAYPLQESPQQALHLLIDALRLRWIEIPSVATNIFALSPSSIIAHLNEQTKKVRIVADEQDNRLYLFSGDQFVYSGIASATSGNNRIGSNAEGKITWSLQQEPNEHKASIIFQQYFPISPTIDATVSRREHRTSIEYMIAGTLSFPKGFVASFTGTFMLDRAAVQPLQNIPEHAIPWGHWKEVVNKGS